MKIFIAYAEDDQQVAQAISASLRAEGHTIVYPPPSAADPTAGQAGRALARADFMVYLLSPLSVGAGSQSLTNVFQFRKRWRSPRARILPILVRPVADAELPGTVRDLVPVSSHGNLAADVSNLVAARRAPAKRFRSLVAAAGAGLAAVATVMAFLLYPTGPRELAVAPEFVVTNPDQFVYWGSAPVYGIKLDKPGSISDYACALGEPTGPNIVKATADPRCKTIEVEMRPGPFENVTEEGFQIGGTVPYVMAGDDGRDLKRGAVDVIMSNTSIMLRLTGLEPASDSTRASYFAKSGQTYDVAVVNDGNALGAPYVCSIDSADFQRVSDCKFRLTARKSGWFEIAVQGAKPTPKLLGRIELLVK